MERTESAERRSEEIVRGKRLSCLNENVWKHVVRVTWTSTRDHILLLPIVHGAA